LDFDADQMAAYVAGLNEKPFRAKQLMQWIHQRGISDINDMSDLAKSFRATLLDKAEVLSLPIIKDEHATDGTRKWLLDVGAGNAFNVEEKDFIDALYCVIQRLFEFPSEYVISDFLAFVKCMTIVFIQRR
jgi:adenine C2-methylase RlmN of 23S rRNA A2503 and tRNA A37